LRSKDKSFVLSKKTNSKMDQVNTVRLYFRMNFGYGNLKTEIMTFLTLGDQKLPGVAMKLSKDGPAFTCEHWSYEWIRSRRPAMSKPPGMRTKIESPLKEMAAAIQEKYQDYHAKSLLHLCRTKTFYQHRHEATPLDYVIQLQLHTEMRNVNYDPNGHTLSDEVTDGEYINWEPVCDNERQALVRYLNCIKHENKVAYQLAQKAKS
jgi:hypothetical protein